VKLRRDLRAQTGRAATAGANTIIPTSSNDAIPSANAELHGIRGGIATGAESSSAG